MQKSKVASVRIFGETLKHEAIDDSDNLSRATEVAYAYAALLAIDHGGPGIYNIAQSNRHVATEKARAELGWTPDFRIPA